MISNHFSNTQDKTDFSISIVVILLAGLLIGYYSLGGYNNTRLVESTEVVNEMELNGRHYSVLEEPADVNANISTRNKRYSKKEIVPTLVYPVIKSDDSTNVSSELVTNIEEAEEVELISPDDEINKAIEEVFEDEFDDEDFEKEIDSDVIVDSTIIEDISDDIVSDETIEEVPTTESEVKTSFGEPEAKIDYNTDCIILIGAFSNQKNISKLIGRLNQSGYPIFKSPFNGLTRVGIYVDCDDSPNELRKMRSKYSNDAMILKAD